MALTVYWYPRCGTCRKAVKWLEEQGREIKKIDLVENPPSREELAGFVRKSGHSVKQFFNVSGVLYREMQLKDKLGEMSDEQKLELLSEHGKLIKRPIVTDGERVTVGFKEDQFDQMWSVK